MVSRKMHPVQRGNAVRVEICMGEVGGKEALKLGRQVLITASGAVPMSRAPLVDAIEV